MLGTLILVDIIILAIGIVAGFKISQLLFQKKIKLSFVNDRNPPETLKDPPKDTKVIKIQADTQQYSIEDKIWHEEETAFVFDLHEDLSFKRDKSEIIRSITDSVHKFLSVKNTVFISTDKNSDKLKLEYAVGLNNKLVKDLSLNKDESISGFVIAQAKPLWMKNLFENDYLNRMNQEYYLGKSFISIPIMFHNEVMGVLHVCNKVPEREFTQRDFSFLVNIGRVSAIALKNARLQEQIENDYLKTMTTLAATIDARDHYTKWHSENVARYSLAIAEKMDCNHQFNIVLERAALLHDIGKIGIRDNVLLKPDKLTSDEFKQIKRHSAIGDQMISSLSFLEEAAILIRQHHERCDGSGYPDGIKADEIKLGAKILAVADTFDAMFSDRPYRKGMSITASMRELLEAKNSKLDPKVVDCFLRIIKDDSEILRK
ncbi:MAG TPA: HD domain-containing protein [Candidatus Omnitrophica bacterium]|nr:HD domain-containing protein [Candidatus Omnitrophota bacterium]